MPFRDTGLDVYARELKGAAAARGAHVLELRNPTEYAGALQDLDGYEVIDEAHFAATADANLAELVASDLPLTSQRIDRALDRAGFEETNYLRSLTGGTTDDGRSRHPGHWADETGLLANAYEHEVNPAGGRSGAAG